MTVARMRCDETNICRKATADASSASPTDTGSVNEPLHSVAVSTQFLVSTDGLRRCPPQPICEDRCPAVRLRPCVQQGGLESRRELYRCYDETGSRTDESSHTDGLRRCPQQPLKRGPRPAGRVVKHEPLRKASSRGESSTGVVTDSCGRTLCMG